MPVKCIDYGHFDNIYWTIRHSYTKAVFLLDFMMKKTKFAFFFAFSVHFLFISPILYAQTAFDADSAAKRLEASLAGNSSAPSAQVTRGRSQPKWVNDPYITYPRDRYIAAIGSAPDRAQAEARAFAALAAIFGQSVRSEFTVTTMYSEAVSRGIISVSDNTSVRDVLTTSVALDKLAGAEIGNIWDSTRGMVYAAAYMEKSKAISIYTDMIIINNRNIESLTAMSDSEKNSFSGLSRYRLSALIAGINANYASVVTQSGGSVSSLNIRSADSINIEAAKIIQNITVTVKVTNDRANRVQDAFAGVLSSRGIRTRGNNPQYTLEVNLQTNDVSFSGSEYKFCRIEASANLIENQTGASLFPFNFNVREGHTSYANAEAAAFAGAEKEIAQKFSAVLSEFLMSAMP